ncbi:hypothetical protein GYMLUDRAFT_36175 [Collybiopsis luxurians FD-317 M1]|nr:hypothetical protein GYMLUDRAFT_36175 [Collybiopsis luxurians FD-317 M1]
MSPIPTTMNCQIADGCRVNHVVAPTPAMEASAKSILRWRDAEVASALKNFKERECEHMGELERRLHASQTSLLRCEENLRAARNSEAKMHAAHNEATWRLVRLSQVEEDLGFVLGELGKIGICFRKNVEEKFGIVRRLVVDAQKEVRWSGLQRVSGSVFENMGSNVSPSTDGRLPDASSTINALLDATQKDRPLHAEFDRLKQDLNLKSSKVAELETTIALLRAEDVGTISTGISPSQLLRDRCLSATFQSDGSAIQGGVPLAISVHHQGVRPNLSGPSSSESSASTPQSSNLTSLWPVSQHAILNIRDSADESSSPGPPYSQPRIILTQPQSSSPAKLLPLQSAAPTPGNTIYTRDLSVRSQPQTQAVPSSSTQDYTSPPSQSNNSHPPMYPSPASAPSGLASPLQPYASHPVAEIVEAQITSWNRWR